MMRVVPPSKPGASMLPRANTYFPPEPAPATGRPAVFLAGSIDMGKAAEWQSEAAELLRDLPVDIYNPRRADWDPDWVQDISHMGFKGQVDWELDHLARAELILFHFDPRGRSPVTMMELGMHAGSGRCVVSCPPGFWRRGNVQVLCHRMGIPLAACLAEAVLIVRSRLGAGLGHERAGRD